MRCDYMSHRRWLPYSSFDYAQPHIRQDLSNFAALISNRSLCLGSWANNNRHVRNYSTFCRRFGLMAFPVTAEALILFFSHHLATGHAVSTLDGIKSAVKREHELNPQWSQWPFLPGAEARRVQVFMTGAKKMFKVAPRRKRPLTLPILLAMARRADLSSARSQQYLTMAFVAHDGLLRFSELRSLRVKDVVWDRNDGTVYLAVRESKANKTGPPEIVALQSYGELSGAALLEAYWVGRSRHEADPEAFLFPVAQEAPGRMDGEVPVCKSNFIKWVRMLLSSIGLVGGDYSGHSFRSGGATDMWSKRMPRLLIKLAGRWKSEAYAIYCRDHPAENAVAVAAAFHDIYSEVLGPYAL